MSVRPIIIQQLSPNDRIKLEFKIEDNLEITDYEKLAGVIEPLTIRRKVSLLIVLIHFQGWNGNDFWKCTQFAAKDFEQIDKIAIVGERTWMKGKAVFCRPFIRAKVRHFEPLELEQARKWIEETSNDNTELKPRCSHVLV